MSQPERGILVLGMHRSGTSALAGLLHLLGAELGRELAPPMEGVNPKGFWEHAGIVAVHERLLAALGSAWHDARDLPPEWWRRAECEPFRRELESAVSAEFGAARLWALKDPRLCRLLPLWRELMPRWPQAFSAILILRAPAEVARSLEVRDRIGLSRSSLLWLQHVVAAERWSRGLPRALITYDELLADWRGTMGRVGLAVGVAFADDAGARERAESFLERELRHHRDVSSAAQDPALQLAESCYATLQQQREGVSTSVMDGIAARVAALAQAAAPWLAEGQALIAERDAALASEQRALASEQRVLELHAAALKEIARIKATVSWRVTKPLRGAWNLLRRPS